MSVEISIECDMRNTVVAYDMGQGCAILQRNCSPVVNYETEAPLLINLAYLVLEL